MGVHTDCKMLYGRYIEDSPNLPDHIKPVAKQFVFGIINLIPEYLGHLELIWRREEGGKVVSFDRKRKEQDALDDILDSFERFCSRG